MALLLLDRAQMEIKAEGDTLALYEAGTRRGTVPVALVDQCVIQGAQTKLDTGVLLKLADAGATTIIMSPRQLRRVAIVLGSAHNDAAVRLAQAQRVMDDVFCRNWALGLMRAKTARQLRTLRRWQAHRPDARKPLTDALLTVQHIAETLQVVATPELSALRGLEGAAARAYFGGFAGVLAPALRFSGRNRRPPRDPANVCLSLGYTLLHTQAVGACVAAGLDPLLGFYHRPAFGRESLASDLIEPLRPAVDLWAWEMLRSLRLREDHFTQVGDACLLGKAGRSHFYAQWHLASKGWGRWLRQQARSLARQLRNEGLPWLTNHDEAPDAEDERC